uniref:Transmembrane protein n=1 Tax=Peronospora matthiolae TaxID=2874970 RepID=A0AAV1VLC7_9STRA
MFIFPVEEDSWLFRSCLYYGILVLLAELFVPLVFHRRVRFEIPQLVLPTPAVPLPPRVFRQRRRKLQQQVAALQRALAETPRLSPQEKRHYLRRSATKRRLAAAAASPSFVTSSGLGTPGRSLEVKGPRPFHETEWTTESVGEEDEDRCRLWTKNKERSSPFAADLVHKSSPSPMAMSHFFRATRAARQGGFSFHEAIEEGKAGDVVAASGRKEPNDRKQVMDGRRAGWKESPTFSRQRPVRLVSEDAERVGYTGSGEAVTQLEALIRVRRRQQANTRHSKQAPLSRSGRVALLAPAEKLAERSATYEAEPTACGALPTMARQLREGNVMEDNVGKEKARHIGTSSLLRRQSEKGGTVEEAETKEMEQAEPLTAFQVFCESFAAGGSAAARQAVAKRKHCEAFEATDTHMYGSSTAALQFYNSAKRPRNTVRSSKQSHSKNDTAATPHSVDERLNDNKGVTNAAVSTHRVLEKRKHDQAFGTAAVQERLSDKTPRIVRRISFDDDADTLAATSLENYSVQRSNGKRKKTLDIVDDDDEDAEWRESLAFQPRQLG